MMLQTAHAVPASAKDLIISAGIETKIVLAILIVLSLVSWAIIFAVGREISASLKASIAFARDIGAIARITEASELARRSTPNAAQRIYLRAIQFVGESAKTRPVDAYLDATTGTVTSPTAASRVETLHLILDSESLAERDRLNRFLPWLATIGSASPLIGLLGTVLGIISAFLGIATSGSGNLGSVAPGVAQALVATAAALSVAIPATFGYNILANRVNRLDNTLESFGTLVISMLVREGRV